MVLDRFEAERAVGGRSRKHNADGMGLMHLCQRAEKPVNRHVWIELLFGWARSKQQNPIGSDHDFVAGNHIDMIGFHLHIVGDFQNWNPRHLLQELRQHAFMARIQMLYEHVGHAGIFRNRFEEFFKGIQSAGRCADTHHGKKVGRRLKAGRIYFGCGFGFHKSRVVRQFMRHLAHFGECKPIAERLKFKKGGSTQAERI